MVRRFVSIFFAILVLIPAFTGNATVFNPTLTSVNNASSPGETVYPYINENPYYSYAYPQGWQVLDQNSTETPVDFSADLSLSGVVGPYLEKVKDLGFAMFLPSDLSEFMIVMTQSFSVNLSADDLIAVIHPLANQIMASSQGAAVISEGERMDKGDNAFAKVLLSVPIPGSPDMSAMVGMYIAIANSTLYAIIYINMNDVPGLQRFEETLASFFTDPLSAEVYSSNLPPVGDPGQTNVPAISESPNTYIKESPYLAYTYPQGWRVVDQSNALSNEELSAILSQNSLAANFIPKGQDGYSTLFLSPSYEDFAALLIQDIGYDLSNDFLVPMMPLLSTEITQALADMVPGGENLMVSLNGDGEMMQVGEKTFMKVLLAFPSKNLLFCLYITLANSHLYMLTYCSMNEASLPLFEASLAYFTTSR